MKRLLSIVLAISMVAVLCISPMAITVTQHTNPSTGGPCNNTYYTYRHGTAPSAQNGWHYHTDGRVCNITAVTYVHECYCSSCGPIAIHNAKVLKGIESSFANTIMDVQSHAGMDLYGLLGTNANGIGLTLEYYGIEFETFSTLDEMENEGIYIIKSRNSDNIISGMHYEAIFHFR